VGRKLGLFAAERICEYRTLRRAHRMKADKISFLIAGYVLLAGCSEKTDSNQAIATGPVLIEPRVCVGKVRAGMSLQEIQKELGPAQRRGNALEYSSFGFAVMFDSNGTVNAVMCGDVTGINGPFVTGFKGRTKEGIGMRSTRDEVVNAYGQPTVSETFPRGLESMQYPVLGVTFTLEGGQVHHLIVRLGSSVETNRTVTLEPPP
jgi:hypothetical protein